MKLITHPQYKKPTKPQIRVILDYVGIPTKDQGKTTIEKRSTLEKYAVVYPEEYSEAYTLIVLHKNPHQAVVDKEPKDKVQIEREQMYHKLGLMIVEHFSTVENKAVDSVKSEYEKLLESTEKRALDIATEAIKEASKRFETIRVEINDSKPTKISGVVHETFEKMIQLACARKNLLLVGPTGSGKTHVAKQISEALKLDFSTQSCSAGMSESQLNGWLLPIGEKGNFVYVSSEFVRIYENGGIFLFDEMDAADPNVLIFINQALANGEFFLPQRYDKPHVKQHQDFVAIAAMNTFGTGADAMYHARNALDAATLDRFKIGTVIIDYSRKIEESLVDEEILTWGLEVRRQINSHKLKKIMSTRLMIDGTDMKQAGWELKDVQEAYFADWSRDEKLAIGA